MDSGRLFICPPKDFYIIGDQNDLEKSHKTMVFSFKSRHFKVHDANKYNHDINKLVLERLQVNTLIDFDEHDKSPIQKKVIKNVQKFPFHITKSRGTNESDYIESRSIGFVVNS